VKNIIHGSIKESSLNLTMVKYLIALFVSVWFTIIMVKYKDWAWAFGGVYTTFMSLFLIYLEAKEIEHRRNNQGS
jgi:uncharacterized membrane protein